MPVTMNPEILLPLKDFKFLCGRSKNSIKKESIMKKIEINLPPQMSLEFLSNRNRDCSKTYYWRLFFLKDNIKHILDLYYVEDNSNRGRFLNMCDDQNPTIDIMEESFTLRPYGGLSSTISRHDKDLEKKNKTTCLYIRSSKVFFESYAEKIMGVAV